MESWPSFFSWDVDIVSFGSIGSGGLSGYRYRLFGVFCGLFDSTLMRERMLRTVSGVPTALQHTPPLLLLEFEDADTPLRPP